MFTLRTGISREKSKHRNIVDSVDSVDIVVMISSIMRTESHEDEQI